MLIYPVLKNYVHNRLVVFRLDGSSKVIVDDIERRLLSQLAQYRESYAQVKTVYYGNKWGGFITGRKTMPSDKARQTYDPRKRPWYKASADAPSRPLLSQPYLGTDGVSMDISISHGVSKNNELIGVFAMDLSLKELEKK